MERKNDHKLITVRKIQRQMFCILLGFREQIYNPDKNSIGERIKVTISTNRIFYIYFDTNSLHYDVR